MKRTLRTDPRLAGIALWLSVLLFAAAGYALGIAPQEHRLRATLARAQALYDKGNANHRILVHAAEIRHARDRVRADIRRRSAHAGASSTLEAALRSVDREAATHGVEIRSLTPGPTSHEGGDVIGEAVTLDVVGHFANIMTMLANLSRRDALIEVGQVRIEALSRTPSPRPLLLATISASIDRIDPRYVEEDSDATSIAR